MKRICLFIGLLLLAFTAKAQKYHDAKAFGLNGHVKECVVIENEDDVFWFSQIEFDQDGRLIFYDYHKPKNINRNSDGYITSLYEYTDKTPSMVFKYDTNHTVIEIKHETFSVLYSYDNKGKPIKNQIVSDEVYLNGTLTLETSAYDKHNNFLEFKQINSAGRIYKRHRNITYWDDSSSKDNFNLWNLSDIAFFNTVKVQKVMPVVVTNMNNNFTMKRRIVFTAPKGTTSNEVTDLYLVGYAEKDEFESHIPVKIYGLAYHDLGPNEFLGIDVIYTEYKYNTSEIKETRDFEWKIEGEPDAQYLLDFNTNDTEWICKRSLWFHETKDEVTRKHKK